MWGRGWWDEGKVRGLGVGDGVLRGGGGGYLFWGEKTNLGDEPVILWHD